MISNETTLLQEITKISITGASKALSIRNLERALENTLKDTSLAVCLHRIDKSESEKTINPLSITSSTLTKILISLNRIAENPNIGQIHITFDDGYNETLEFICENSHLYQKLHWIYFICPKKSLLNEGYSWDLPNSDAKLASLETCLKASKEHNFKIGNHTNSHRVISDLSDSEIISEINESIEILQSNKIQHIDFAYPFGHPEVHFHSSQSDLIRKTYIRNGITPRIWSTKPYPYRNSLKPKNIPRIPILGTDNATSSLSKILMQSIKLKIKNASLVREK